MDEGIRAASAKKRGGFNRMFAGAMAGKPDSIVMKSAGDIRKPCRHYKPKEKGPEGIAI